METKKLQFHYFIGILLVVLAFALVLLWPFVPALALAFMTAIIVRPLNRRVIKAFGGRETLAAFASVAIVLLVVLIPVMIITEQVTVESINFYSASQQGGPDLTAMAGYVIEPIHNLIPSFNPDVKGFADSISTNLAVNAKSIFSSTATVVIDVFIAVIALFYLLRDGHELKKAAIELSPLADVYDREIVEKVERAVNSVVRGSLFVSLIRGALTTVGFGFFGVPHAILWGVVTAFVSLLPNIGMFITLIPALLYLLAAGSVTGAIGLAVWSIVILGFVDNIVTPYAMGKGFAVHPLFVLLSVLGGLLFFGPVGLLIGPLVIALLAALLEIYRLVVIEHKAARTNDLK